jgi:hypothetical protein
LENNLAARSQELDVARQQILDMQVWNAFCFCFHISKYVNLVHQAAAFVLLMSTLFHFPQKLMLIPE